MGEDRWLCTITIQHGWRIEYVALSCSLTAAPTDLFTFFKQRRRWAPSTVLNVLEISLFDSQYILENNEYMKYYYILYLLLSQMASFLGPAMVLLLVVSSARLTFGISPLVSFLICGIPAIVFTIVCVIGEPGNKQNEKLQKRMIQLFSIFYQMIMTCVIVSLLFSLLSNGICGFCNMSNQFLLMLIFIFSTSAFLHGEFKILLNGFMYFMLMPTMFIMLYMFAFGGMDNLSWGTRESSSGGSDQTTVKKPSIKPLYTWRCGDLFDFLCCFVDVNIFYGDQRELENGEKLDNLEQSMTENTDHQGGILTNEYMVEQENILHDDKIDKERYTYDKKNDILRQDPKNDEKNNKKQDDQPFATLTNLFADRFPYDQTILKEEYRKLFVEKDSEIKEKELPMITKEEAIFWKSLIRHSLYPETHPYNDKARAIQKQSATMKRQVRSTRNSYLLMILVLNGTWLAVNIAIQLVYDDVAINTKGIGCRNSDCPVQDVQPFSILAFIFYIVVLFIQYFCMIFHRIRSFSMKWKNYDDSMAGNQSMGRDSDVARVVSGEMNAGYETNQIDSIDVVATEPNSNF